MTHFDYTLEGPIGRAATLGMIVLKTDETIEHDLRRSFDAPDVSLYVSRVPSGADVTRDTLAQMSAALPAAAKLLPPELRYDVVGYGCTSGTAVIGAEKIAEHGAYRRVGKVARIMLDGEPRILTKGATYYHTTAVRPSWSRKFTQTTKIGVHKFYRDHRTASN